MNEAARRAINAELKKTKAEISKKERKRDQLNRDIENLQAEAADLDKSLEE